MGISKAITAPIQRPIAQAIIDGLMSGTDSFFNVTYEGSTLTHEGEPIYHTGG